MSLLQMSFYGAIFILAIVILRAATLHRLPKKVFVVLWYIALLRLLVPFSVPSAFSLYSVLPVESFLQEFTPSDTEPPTEHFLRPVPSPSVSQDTVRTEPSADISTGMPSHFPVTAVYIVGALGVAAFFIITYLRCRREFATSLPCENPEVLSWQSAHPLKWEYEIRQSDRICAPLTYGIFHPVILLPKSINNEEKNRLHYVLLHEYTHIRHLDTLTKLFIILTVCLHWFNPFVWVMYILFNRDIEFYCDACVLAADNTDSRSSYADTLIRLEEHYSFSMPLCNHFSKTAIEERIASIMKSKKTTFGMLLAGVFIILFFSITLLTTADTAYGEYSRLPFPSPTMTPTPSPAPTTPPPTVTPSPGPMITVTPQEAVTESVQLTSGELYETAVMIFEQFRQSMNDEIYHRSFYPETYSLTVWKHREDHLSIDYCFYEPYADNNLLMESGILSLLIIDGTWQIVAYLPDRNAN